MRVPGAVALIRSPSLSSVAEYAYAVTAPVAARLIVLAGACPLNADGSTAAPGEYAGQAAKAVKNMRTALGVTVLGYAGQLVEIEAVAAVLDRAGTADGR